MPPLGAQSVEAAVRHRFLQQLQVRANRWVIALVLDERRRRKAVEIGRHRNFAAGRIHQRGIDGGAANMHGTDAPFRISHIGLVPHGLPQFLLGRARPVSVPDFQAVPFFLEVFLRDHEPGGHACADQRRHSGRIQGTAGDVVRASVAQLNEDARIDARDVHEIASTGLGFVAGEGRPRSDQEREPHDCAFK
jgi:hypothetical protein